MARLRYSLEEAREQAELLADQLVAETSWTDTVQRTGAFASSLDRQGKSSKHPTVWTVVYQLRPPQGTTIDGGEVFVKVDLEDESAAFHD